MNSTTNGTTINTCTGTIYDSGGASGQYQNYEDYVFTICSNTGSTVELTITSFATENNYDYLYIYDGTNTSAPLIISSSGSPGIQGQIFESTGTCITLRFSSDVSSTFSGFQIAIACGIPCLDYSIDLVSTNPTVTNTDSLWIDICLGESITFTSQGTYPNSGNGYTQSDATTDWYWSVSSSGAPAEFNGVGMTNFTYTFDESGGFFIDLYAIDANGCIETYDEQFRVRVSIPPSFSNITQDQTIVCPGEDVNFTGDVTTNSWVMSITDTQVVQECITDDQGVTQSFCWNVNAFQPGQEIESGDELESVCMNIEHSWVADVWIYIQCPNGQQAEINYYSTSNPCSGDEFGNPDELDNCNPGVGYDYCWTMDATQCHTDWCDDIGGIIPSGDYLPTGDFNDLVGCPINGEWCVVIIDDWGSDDGTLFAVSMNFDNSILPVDTWSMSHTYDSNDMTWSGDGINPNSGGTATANPTTPGDQTYTFSVVDDFGCQYDTTLTVHVRNFDDALCCEYPTTSAGTDAHVCTDTYTFNATLGTGNTGTWSVISGPGTVSWANQNSPHATATVDTWGVYEFEWTEQHLTPTCSNSDQVIVEFYPVPTTTFTYDPILCNGDHSIITYIGNVDATATYNWDFDGATIVSGSGQGPYEIYWTSGGTHYMALQVSANGCDSPDTLVNIINPALLTHTLEVFDDPCFQSCNGRAEINVTGGTTPYDYSWSASSSVLANVCAGDYSITVIDANGCTTGEDFTINQPPELVINDISFTHLTCYQSDDGTITVDAAGGTGTIYYIWSDIGNGLSLKTGLIAGNYCVTVQDDNGCTLMECIDITQPDELVVVTSSNVAICEGTQTVLQATAMGGTPAYTYLWDQGEGYNPASSSLTLTPDTTTTYYVSVTDANGCESNIATIVVTVSPEMVIDSIILQHNRCYNSCDGRAEIVMHGGLYPLQYSWGSPNHIYDGLCEGIYTVTVTDLIGCTVSDMFIITEPTQLTYTYTTEPATCNGYDDGEASIFVQGGVPPYTYLWPNGHDESTINTYAGTYTVTVLDDHLCRITAPFTIEQPDAIYVLPVGNRTICQGQSATLTSQATGGTPYYDFHWSGNDGSVYNSNLYVVSPTQNTIYTLVVTDSHGCSSSPVISTVYVNPDLEILSVTTSNDTICPGDPAIIHVAVQGGNGGPYLMTLQNGNVVPSPFSVYPDSTTMYYIQLADMCGTPTVVDSILINVRPKPSNVFVAEDIAGCPPFAAQFYEQSPDLAQTYLWDFGDNGFATSKSPIHIYENPGVYSVSLEVRDFFGCKHERTVDNMITIYQSPTANFSASPEIVSMLAPEVEFTNYSLDAINNYWYFGDGDSSLFVNPRHMYPSIGEYEITLIVESINDCTDTTTRSIIVQNEFAFYMPTSFTPNGDGMNDCMRPCGNGIDKNNFKMLIYDRWGNLVFETDEFDPDVACDACSEGAWDGTDNGSRAKGDEILPNGLYHWYCEFKDWNGTIFNEQGTVTLIR